MSLGVADLKKIEKRANHDLYQEAGDTLKKRYKEDPKSIYLTHTLLKGLHGLKEAQENENNNPKCWPATYGVISKFPIKAITKMFHSQDESCFIDQHRVKIWKLSEPHIYQHLLEFTFGVCMKYSWPQGPCHKHDVLERVLTLWRQHHTGQYTVPTRLAAIPQEDMRTMQVFDWQKWGVYEFFPEDTVSTQKTHVHHKPSGSMVEIPRSINIETGWSIDNNWSDNEAKLRDSEGQEHRLITAFFQLATVGLAMEDWIEFAAMTAERVHQNEGIVNEALNIVLRAAATAPNNTSSSSTTAPASPHGAP